MGDFPAASVVFPVLHVTVGVEYKFALTSNNKVLDFRHVKRRYLSLEASSGHFSERSDGGYKSGTKK